MSVNKNSVLHQVLQETGANDVETEPRNVPSQEKQESYQWRGWINNVTKRSHAFLPMSWKPASLRMLLASLFVSRSSIDSLHLAYQRRTLNRLLSSPIFCKDDSVFLDLYIKEGAEEDSLLESGNVVDIYRHRSVARGTIFVLSFIMILLGALHAVLGGHSSPFPSVLSMPGFPLLLPFAVAGLAVDLFMLAILLFVSGLSFIWSFKFMEEKIRLKIVKDLQQAEDHLQSFEKLSQELVQSMIKCLRFVKDSELVARGFLVARPTSNSGGVSFDSDPHHWCPRLRHLLFDGSSQMVREVKDTIRRMHQSMSLTPDFEVFNDKYLQQQDPSFELLRLFDEDSASSGDSPSNPFNDDVEFVNNVIPSPKLSALLLLFRMHISYFFRGLAVCFSKQCLEGGDPDPDFFPSMAMSVMPLGGSMGRLLGAARESHAFYRACARAGEGNPNRHAFDQAPRGPAEDLYRCVNSLDIRLQSLAERAMKLRLELEKKTEEEEEEASQRRDESIDGDAMGVMSSSDKMHYEEALRHIKIDLDLCIGCYEESLRKLNAKEKQEAQSSHSTETATSESTAAAGRSPTNAGPKVVSLKEPVIVDEVFEATIEAGEDEPQEGPSLYRRFTKEERDQMRQHRDDLKRFSRELHAVVGQRAIVQRQREEVALARVQARSTANEAKSSPEKDIVAERSSEEIGVDDAISGSTARQAGAALHGMPTTVGKNGAGVEGISNQEGSLVVKGKEEETVEGGECLEEPVISSSVVGVLDSQPPPCSLSTVQMTAANEASLPGGEGMALFMRTSSSELASTSGKQLISVSSVLHDLKNGVGGRSSTDAYPLASSTTLAVQQSSDTLPHLEADGNIVQDAVEKENIPESLTLEGNKPLVVVGIDGKTERETSEAEFIESQASNRDALHLKGDQSELSLPATQMSAGALEALQTGEEMTESSTTSNLFEPTIDSAVKADPPPSAAQGSENLDVAQRKESVADPELQNCIANRSSTPSLQDNSDQKLRGQSGVSGLEGPEMQNQNTGQVESLSASKANEGHMANLGLIATPKSHASNSDARRNLSNVFLRNSETQETVNGVVDKRNTLESQSSNSDAPTTISQTSGQTNSLSQQENNLKSFETGGGPSSPSTKMPRPTNFSSTTNSPTLNSPMPAARTLLRDQASMTMGSATSSPQAGSRAVGETYSMLAVKLTSAENSVRPKEDMRELLPGARKKAEALYGPNGRRMKRDTSPPSAGVDRVSRRRSPAPQQPYMEGWRSSVQKSKEMHWKKCEEHLHQNLGLDPSRIRGEVVDNEGEPSSESVTKNVFPDIEVVTDKDFPPKEDPDNLPCNNSSFLEITMADEMLFMHDEQMQLPPYDENRKRLPMTQSQVGFPPNVDPDHEGFIEVNGTLVSRHNFTPDGGVGMLHRGFQHLQQSGHFSKKGDDHDNENDRRDWLSKGTGDDESSQDPPVRTPNPNRRRHNAERDAAIVSKDWVNITHVEVQCDKESRFDIIRQKEVTNQDVQLCPQVPTPDPTSSFNASLALMAAARAHSFPCFMEEHYVSAGGEEFGDHDDDDLIGAEGGAVGGFLLPPLETTTDK